MRLVFSILRKFVDLNRETEFTCVDQLLHARDSAGVFLSTVRGRQCPGKLSLIMLGFLGWTNKASMICCSYDAHPSYCIFLAAGHNYSCYQPEGNKLGVGILNNNLK